MSREMKHSGIDWIGDIPKEWEKAKYKYFAQNRMGETILREDTTENGVPIYSATQDSSIFGYISNPKLLLKKGDFVIPARGNSIGCISIVKEDKATCTQTTICSRNIHNINNLFLYYLALGLKDYWFRYDGSAIPQITVNQVNNNVVLLPPLLEQQKIADYLDKVCGEIDGLVALQEAMIDELKAYKQSVITEAVTRGLNPNVPLKPSGIDWIGTVPKTWAVKKIGNLYRVRNEKVSDKDYPPLSVTMKGVLPQLETAAKTNNGDDRKLVRKGDFAINSRSDRRGSCGVSSYDGSVSLINTILTPISQMNPQYYNWLFHTTLFADEFYKWGHGIVDDLWTTRWQEMKNISIVFPPLSQQQQIASFLDEKCAEIDSLIAIKQNKIEELKEYKKSIIYEYVTGKKEVL